MFDNIKSWWSSPYGENMSAARWFLFVGFLLLVGAIWTIIIRHMTAE